MGRLCLSVLIYALYTTVFFYFIVSKIVTFGVLTAEFPVLFLE